MSEIRAIQGWSSVGGDPLETLLRPGGIAVVFQPILEVTARGNVLWGVECLARAAPDTLGGASEIFEHVRARGAEVPMDRACVRAALRASTALPRVPRWSINVHARTLADDRHFGGFLLNELRRVGMSPRKLALELLAPRDLTPALLEALEQLRAVGVSVGIDDVGLSSTDYEGLVECRPDYLKVDRCFVRLGRSDDLREAVLESVVRLAEGIGAAVVAEGVETAHEQDAVMQQGILLVQGHLFGAPMTAEALERTGLLDRAPALACG